MNAWILIAASLVVAGVNAYNAVNGVEPYLRGVAILASALCLTVAIALMIRLWRLGK